MAKEQWHNWMRTVVMAAVIIFSCGGYAMKIHGNSGDIVKVEDRVTVVEGEFHEMELNQRDTINTYNGILAALSDIKTEQKSFRVSQQATAIAVTEIRGQVDNLVKVD